MYLYGQDPEVRLLKALAIRLDVRTFVDVGAELGDISQEMLIAGLSELHAFDPHPNNVSSLRTRFHNDSRITVHDCAVSDGDGVGELHVSVAPGGGTLSFGHTLLERGDTDEIRWEDTLTVRRQSLGSLVNAQEIPKHAGILKIDTEGHDLAVVRGMGSLEADIVMVEHWTDLPHGLGKCPWTTEEMTRTMRERGFTHFAFIVHRGEFVTLKWDDGEVEPGAMGNLVFLHDSVFTRLLPDILDCASWLAERAVHVGQEHVQIANDRLAVIDEVKQAADNRLALVDELKQAANDRLTLIDRLTEVSQARGGALEELEARLQIQSAELESFRSRIDNDPTS